MYGDETDIRRLCAFLSVSLHETQKRQTENRTNNKTFTKHNKVFARLFSKGGAVGGLTHMRSMCVGVAETGARGVLVALRRARKLLPAFFFLIAFSFAPAYAKEKADERLNFFFWMLT